MIFNLFSVELLFNKNYFFSVELEERRSYHFVGLEPGREAIAQFVGGVGRAVEVGLFDRQIVAGVVIVACRARHVHACRCRHVARH